MNEGRNPWQRVDYLRELEERFQLCTDVIELISERATRAASRNWAYHLPQIVDAIDFFRGLCREEIEHYGEWRDHGFQIDEVIDFIDEDLVALTEWICRMTNIPLPAAINDNPHRPND